MNPTVKRLLSLLIIAGVSVGLLFVADLATGALLQAQENSVISERFDTWLAAARYEELNTDKSEPVTAAHAAKNTDGNTVGYGVTAVVQGYAGTIEVHTALSADGKTVKGIRIGAHKETEGYGARVAEPSFTSRFENIGTPVVIAGGTSRLEDGTYRAEADAETFGFLESVEITVTDGRITAANWDGTDRQGQSKKALSKAGEYVMSETSLPWHEQAQVMEQALLQVQDPSKLAVNSETGKADGYSGATIRVDTFVTLAANAFSQALKKPTAVGSAVEGLSGATASSKAVIAAVNAAAQFVQSYEAR